jgi:type IV secretory pathway TrbF-like protein
VKLAGSSAESTASRSIAEDGNRDLLAALSGKQAGRERAVAENTRRVVMASLGVMQDQKAGRRRTRCLALGFLLLALLALGPFVWRVADDLIGGERIGDIATQASLWVCVLCPVILAAVLMAGWSRLKS